MTTTPPRLPRSWRIIILHLLQVVMVLVAIATLIHAARSALLAARGTAGAAFNLGVVLLLAGIVALQQHVIRRERARLRPRPDYAEIARMERDIWGQAFTHAGAPASAARLGMGCADLARVIRASSASIACDCRRCGSPYTFAREMCAPCSEWQGRQP